MNFHFRQRMIHRAFQKSQWLLWVATGFGVGYLPIAPGTWGTGLAIGVYLLVANLPTALLAITIAALFALGVAASDYTDRYYNSSDNGCIVIDEIVGFLIAVWGIGFSWPHVLTAFLAFRIFDILKPFPARSIDNRVKGGIGVMSDDLIAGIYANITVRIVIAIF